MAQQRHVFSRTFHGDKWGGSINGVPPNGRFIMEKPIKVDDLGVAYFRKASSSAGIRYGLVLMFFSTRRIIDHH